MEVAIYFSLGFFTDKSNIFKITGFDIDEKNNKKFVKIFNTDTTASNLYTEGWRLVQVIHLDSYCSTQLIFERPTN